MQNPKQTSYLMSYLGVIPNIMEVLELKNSSVAAPVLDIVNIIVRNDLRIQENMALIGMVPLVVKLAKFGVKCDPDTITSKLRIEAANFIGNMCSSASLPLHMFIACGGLQVLVDMLRLENDDEECDRLINVALDGISKVFSLPVKL